MTEAHELPYGDHHESEPEPDDDPRIAEFLRGKYPDLEISLHGERLMAVQLANLKRKYGDPESPTYRYYHNDQHSLDALERSFRILSIVSKVPGLTIEDSDYELLGLAIMYHDDILEPADGLTPERRSADQLVAVMRENGYDETQITRAENAVMATEVRFDNGQVLQINAKEIATDPIVFATAFADIGATVIEGGQRLVQDVVNLAIEQSGNAVSESVLFGLIQSQYEFVTQRFDDMTEYIDKLCAGNKQAAAKLKDAILTQINTNYQEALEVAKRLRDNLSEVSEAVGAELKKPVKETMEQREKIHHGILTVLRKLYRRSTTE